VLKFEDAHDKKSPVCKDNFTDRGTRCEAFLASLSSSSCAQIELHAFVLHNASRKFPSPQLGSKKTPFNDDDTTQLEIYFARSNGV
jgi:hypothetical protein